MDKASHGLLENTDVCTSTPTPAHTNLIWKEQISSFLNPQNFELEKVITSYIAHYIRGITRHGSLEPLLYCWLCQVFMKLNKINHIILHCGTLKITLSFRAFKFAYFWHCKHFNLLRHAHTVSALDIFRDEHTDCPLKYEWIWHNHSMNLAKWNGFGTIT